MKLWGGRFTSGTDEAASQFHSSISFDKRLYRHDITGSIAHAEMLGSQGIIPPEDAEKIVAGLRGILQDIENGVLEIDPTAEDIHSFAEAALISRIGEAGGRLHTGRSRNDQVALDMRMYVKSEIAEICTLLRDLLTVLASTARDHADTIIPGFTHLQKAQPVTLAHHMLAYFEMFKRDLTRLKDCYARTDVMPLGSGALAATVYPLDRELVAKKLDFAQISANSLDAVSDRDFCAEFIFCVSTIMMHLSRFCEEIILWATEEYGFITVSDAYSTGSSIMPQKKNPDMAELIRGKTGRVYGNLQALLTTMKSLPLAYNKDMQEDKHAVFDTADTARACLGVFTGMLAEVRYNKEAMYKSAGGGYTNATDVADWLVKQGVAFRDAHEITGRLVLLAIDKGVRLNDLPLEEYQAVCDKFNDSIYQAISLEASVNARNIPGGPAREAVLEAVKMAEGFLKELKG